MIELVFMMSQADAAPPPFAGAEVSDSVLAEQRGGVRLPNGIDLAMAVQTDSAINGAVVLRTVFELDQGSPKVTVYTPPNGQAVASAPGAANTQASTVQPTINFDGRGRIEVSRGLSNIPISVGATIEQQREDASESGLQVIDTTGPVQTDNGLVTAMARGGLGIVNLAGKDFSISHINGAAFGSAIANSGSNRTIDTQTIVSIDIRNAGPDVLGSAMLRVDGLVSEAVGGRL